MATTGGNQLPEDAKLTKAELLEKLQEYRAELVEARASVKAWYEANPVALVLVAVISFGAGALIF